MRRNPTFSSSRIRSAISTRSGSATTRSRSKNPRLIYASITPFGDTGPGKDYNWADIITWAAGGMMYMMGEEGKPPLQMSLPQAGLHAGGEAAVAMMLAHYPRQIDGLGQRIVVNMQACIVWTLMNEQAMPFLHGNHLSRTGIFVGSADARRKMVYECKDGHISILITGGTTFGNSTKALIEWMRENGFGSDWMRTKDWISWIPGVFMKMTEQDRKEIDDLETTIQRFLITMTKHEIYAQGLKRRIFLAPVATVADVAADEQLKARDFWTQVPHDTIGRTLTFPGPFAKTVRDADRIDHARAANRRAQRRDLPRPARPHARAIEQAPSRRLDLARRNSR